MWRRVDSILRVQRGRALLGRDWVDLGLEEAYRSKVAEFASFTLPEAKSRLIISSCSHTAIG